MSAQKHRERALIEKEKSMERDFLNSLKVDVIWYIVNILANKRKGSNR